MKPTAHQQMILKRLREGFELSASLTLSHDGAVVGLGKWRWRQEGITERGVPYNSVSSMLSKGLVTTREVRFRRHGIDLARRVVEVVQ